MGESPAPLGEALEVAVVEQPQAERHDPDQVQRRLQLRFGVAARQDVLGAVGRHQGDLPLAQPGQGGGVPARGAVGDRPPGVAAEDTLKPVDSTTASPGSTRTPPARSAASSSAGPTPSPGSIHGRSVRAAASSSTPRVHDPVGHAVDPERPGGQTAERPAVDRPVRQGVEVGDVEAVQRQADPLVGRIGRRHQGRAGNGRRVDRPCARHDLAGAHGGRPPQAGGGGDVAQGAPAVGRHGRAPAAEPPEHLGGGRHLGGSGHRRARSRRRAVVEAAAQRSGRGCGPSEKRGSR